MQTFIGWLKSQAPCDEADSRYSVEVNYRTKTDEVLKAAAKITLGYASAVLKKNNFHVKQVFEEEPVRILVSSRNWDDGEWVGLVSWHPQKRQYMVSKGFYNKDRKSVAVQSTHASEAENASQIVDEVRNLMHALKREPDRHVEKLKPVGLKRGPK